MPPVALSASWSTLPARVSEDDTTAVTWVTRCPVVPVHTGDVALATPHTSALGLIILRRPCWTADGMPGAGHPTTRRRPGHLAGGALYALRSPRDGSMVTAALS